MASKPEMDRKHEDANPKGPSGKGNRQRDRDRGHGGGGGGDRGNRNSNSNSGGPPKQNRDRGEQVRDRLIQSGMQNTTHLQTREGKIEPRKFTGRCRLFVGNLSTNITDDEFRKLFEPFGETAEIFLNTSKGFGFVKMDTRQHAEAAKAALDFSMVNGKYLRVRFATHGAALKVKNLSPWVSNELLEYAFSFFGEVERAVVIVDDRGRSLEEGIVEFARKQSAQMALKKCQEGCFMITSSLQPVLVEALEQRDEEDGLPEKNFQKSNPHYMKERNVGPRLADPGSFEFEYGMRWKKLYDIENQKREHLEKEIKEARGQLDDQQEFAIYEHETNALREKLRAMEEQTTLIQRERELRREEDRRREEQRRQEELALRQQEEEILRRRNVEEMRRRQDENMMVQAQLRQQEAVLRGMANDNNQMGQNQFDMQGMNMGGQGGPMMQGGGGMPHSGRFDSPHGDMGPNGNGMGNQQMGMRGSGNMGGGGGGGPRGNRDMERRRDMHDDYMMENKRRRY